MDWGTVLITVLASGALSALVTGYMSRRKTTAEAHKINADALHAISDSAVVLVEPLKKRLEDLEKEVETNDKQIKRLNKLVERYAQRIESLMTGITILLKQLAEMNASPCWKPDEWSPGDIIEE